jgi:hypothetical protein
MNYYYHVLPSLTLSMSLALSYTSVLAENNENHDQAPSDLDLMECAATLGIDINGPIDPSIMSNCNRPEMELPPPTFSRPYAATT